jgi:hypothetical protein
VYQITVKGAQDALGGPRTGRPGPEHLRDQTEAQNPHVKFEVL